MTRQGRYPQELHERAVRMVFEHQDQHPSQWAAICSIAAKFGISHETLRNWVRRAETDDGLRPGLTSDERERLKTLEREVRELRRANEILKSAAAFFGAELGCRSPRPATTRPHADPPRPEPCATDSSRRRSATSMPSTSASTAPARSGASCTARGSRWLAA